MKLCEGRLAGGVEHMRDIAAVKFPHGRHAWSTRAMAGQGGAWARRGLGGGSPAQRRSGGARLAEIDARWLQWRSSGGRRLAGERRRGHGATTWLAT